MVINVRKRSVSHLFVVGINPLWKLYPNVRKLLLNSKSRGRIRGTLRTSRYSKSYNFGMLLILELINYISLSSSLRVYSISLVDFSCLSLYVSRVRTMVLSDVSSSFRITHPLPLLPPINALHTYTHIQTQSPTPYLVYPSCGISAQATTRVSVGPVISCSN